MVGAAWGPTDSVPNTWLNDVGAAVNAYLRTRTVLTLANPGATPTFNTDTYGIVKITGQTANITSMTTNATGTPADYDPLWVTVIGTATRTIAWGSKFESGPTTLPTTTTGTERLDVGFRWNSTSSKWRCVAAGSAV